MYVIIAPIQIKEGYKERFIEEMIGDAKGSVNDEPGCLRFDVIQDANDENRIWLYEVYRDAAAFEAHTKAPHFTKWRDAVKDWRADSDMQGAGRGAVNIWPPDGEWK
jgi:quinol monooxygenase YgiN